MSAENAVAKPPRCAEIADIVGVTPECAEAAIAPGKDVRDVEVVIADLDSDVRVCW